MKDIFYEVNLVRRQADEAWAQAAAAPTAVASARLGRDAQKLELQWSQLAAQFSLGRRVKPRKP